MDGIDLALAKLDSALGNVGAESHAALLKAPSGSPVSPEVRREARAAARSGDKLGAVRLLVVAAVKARASVPVGVLDDIEARVAELDGDAADGVREAIAEALAVLRNPPPEPKRGLFGFLRR
ncbi:hypothetical protein Xcel_1972 [Xylanimonas cellulosilytica DSM 15894]|uniref:Uncharacterized protein n=1 Tax=Xylanimonas cellulosilytica (strain DSM 15894 / JCM 12276 / CECT 5975 / KCTC 9989 / LMG 20990 / NBRC 107835 / XIL07) TaxID=446471 RepID=D1BTL2_XYLCX|nr:hypothetical protein [Xylanimonas cellulosilytica]ACZ30991.1 hypothetical protein Xcel_1972 [Xylanimonas cellulosilytica DSM 15894]